MVSGRKFAESRWELVNGEHQHNRFPRKYSHLDYDQLKKALEKCSHGETNEGQSEVRGVCSVCDQNFFSEVTTEISAIVDRFSSRAKHLLHMHLASGFHRYLWCLRHCFINDYLAMVQEGQNLINYVAMNSIAIGKILEEYDEVHCSVNGRNFRRMLQAKYLELLQSPWLIELSAFQINTKDSKYELSCEDICECSYDFSSGEPTITCKMSESVRAEFDLTCPICLDTVFYPVALGCGHIFCNSCACAAASVPIIEDIKTAKPLAKCPLCRQAGVFADSVHLAELNLLLKKRCKRYWKERLYAEKAERTKQEKDYRSVQTHLVLGFM